MGKQLRVLIDRQKCVGSAMCVAIAPGTFVMDGEGKAIVKPHSTEEADRLMRAAEECPALAVIIEDPETNERLFP